MRKGFTLVELIITMVLMGIVAFLGVNILMPVMEGYVDTQTKSLLFSEAQYAASRMAKELRNAIPNTIDYISLDNSGIKFASIASSGYYYPLSNSDNISCVDLNVNKGDNVSIYNTKPEYFYNEDNSERRVYTIENLQPDNNSITCILNKPILKDSPYHRIYKVNKLVAFYLKDNKIYRNSGFDYTADNDSIKNGGYVMASYVKSLRFTYEHGYTYKQAILMIKLVMEKNGTQISYSQEVHIRNVP